MSTLHRIPAPVQPDFPTAFVAFAVGVAPRRRRAPKGGCTVAGRSYRGGSYGLLPVAPAPIVEAEPVIETNPRDSWPEWTDADRWEPAADGDGPLPTWDAETYAPEPIAAAYQLGYELGLAGEYPKPPAHLTEREAHHFNCGRLAGFIASPDGRAWYRDMDTLEDRPGVAGDEAHDCERTGVC